MKFYYSRSINTFHIQVEDGSHVLWADGNLYVDSICVMGTQISHFGTACTPETNNQRVLSVCVKKGRVHIQVSNRPPYDLNWGGRWKDSDYTEFLEAIT